jgi:hypothetical protein
MLADIYEKPYETKVPFLDDMIGKCLTPSWTKKYMN